MTAALACLVLFPSLAPQEAPSGVDPAAAQLMQSAFARFEGLKTFSTRIETEFAGRKGRGNLVAAEDGRLRWNWDDGQGRLTVVSDGRFFFLTHSRARDRFVQQRVISRRLAPVESALMAGIPALVTARLVGGRIPIQAADLASLTREPGPDGTVLLKGLRKAATEGAPRVRFEIEIAERGPELRAVRTLTESGGTTEVAEERLSGTRFNPRLADDAFAFERRGRQVAELFPGYDDRVTIRSVPFAFEGTDLDGDAISLKQLAGRPVLMFAFLVDDETSRAELARIKGLYASLREKGFEVIAVSGDGPEQAEAVRAFRTSAGLDFPIVHDGKGSESPFIRAYQVTRFPFALLIGRDGRVFSVNPRGAVLEAITNALVGR